MYIYGPCEAAKKSNKWKKAVSYKENEEYNCKEYIASAACYFPETDTTVIGIRHWCYAMRFDSGIIIKDNEAFVNDPERAKKCFTDIDEKISIRYFDEGFLTSKGRYVGREEAWEIAYKAGQIEFVIGKGQMDDVDYDKLNPTGKLHSENLC